MSHTRVGVRFAAIGALVVASEAMGAPSQLYEVVRINPTGEGFEKAGTTSGEAVRMNAHGQVVGVADRYAPDGTSRGTAAWFFDGQSTRTIGFEGAPYERLVNGFIERRSAAVDLSDSGWVVGYSSHYDANGMERGHDTWIFDGVSAVGIGPTDAIYQGVLSNGSAVRNSNPAAVNESGIVVGSATRYGADGSTRGFDPWYYDGTVATPLNLTGAPYERVVGGVVERSGFAKFLNEAGVMVGETLRKPPTGSSSRGRDAWVYTGSGGLQIINPTGVDYEWDNSGTIERTGVTTRLTEGGVVCGWSGRYAPTVGLIGFDSWSYDGQSTRIVNPTGGAYELPTASGTYRYGYGDLTNASGDIAGVARRYSATQQLGQDAWVYDGVTTTVISPQDSEHQYDQGGFSVRDVSTAAMNAHGQVTGRALRFSPTGTQLGTDAWVYDGATTKIIGLTGPGYEYDFQGMPHRNGEATAIADSGHVGGFTVRKSSDGLSHGQSAWVYSPITGDTSPIVLSVRTTDQYAYSNITVMSDDGAALGVYSLFSSSGAALGVRAFWWSEADGAYDLGALADGGLSSAGWDRLATIAASTTPGAIGTALLGGPEFILGQGRFLGETADGSVFLMRAVPAPGGLGVLAAAGVLGIRRRTRESVPA